MTLKLGATAPCTGGACGTGCRGHAVGVMAQVCFWLFCNAKPRVATAAYGTGFVTGAPPASICLLFCPCRWVQNLQNFKWSEEEVNSKLDRGGRGWGWWVGGCACSGLMSSVSHLSELKCCWIPPHCRFTYLTHAPPLPALPALLPCLTCSDGGCLPGHLGAAHRRWHPPAHRRLCKGAAARHARPCPPRLRLTCLRLGFLLAG